MIDDPIPWRGELVNVATRLEAKTRQKRWTASTDWLIERDFVVGAYAVRKLIESQQLSDELSGRQIPVRRCEPDGESYDFGNGRRRLLAVADLCREIEHNAEFGFYCGETADLFDGIYVSSRRADGDYAYLLLASDFIALCSDIGTRG